MVRDLRTLPRPYRPGRAALTQDPDTAEVLEALPLAVLLWETGPVALNGAARALLGRTLDVGSCRLAHEQATDAPQALHANGHMLLAVRAPWAPGATLLAAVPHVATDLPDTRVLTANFGLRPREAEVVAHVVSGLTNRATADLLAVSLSTVKTHLRNVYARTQIRSRVELVRQAAPLLLWAIHPGAQGSPSSGPDDCSEKKELPE